MLELIILIGLLAFIFGGVGSALGAMLRLVIIAVILMALVGASSAHQTDYTGAIEPTNQELTGNYITLTFDTSHIQNPDDKFIHCGFFNEEGVAIKVADGVVEPIASQVITFSEDFNQNTTAKCIVRDY